MTNVYVLGYKLYNDNVYAIPCKKVKDIEEARKLILNIHRIWQDEYSDEEYKQKFGRDKVVIIKEETAHIRLLGKWETSGYEYHETEWIMGWQKTDKLGRGAMKCYIFTCQDDYVEYFKHLTEKELKQ